MAFQLSPGVNVSEVDLTTVVPAVATSDGAFAGVFRWGPIGERVFIDSENTLVARFGKPTNFNAETFFTAANFLSYANRLWVARAANTSGATPAAIQFNLKANSSVSNTILVANGSANVAALGLAVGMYINQSTNATAVPTGNGYYITSINTTAIVINKPMYVPGQVGSTAASTSNASVYFARPETAYSACGIDPDAAALTTNTTYGFVSNLVNQIVKNGNDFTSKEGNFDSDVYYLAKYPGFIGNSIRVSVCDTNASYASNVDLLSASIRFEVGANTATVKYRGSANTTAATIAALISVGDQILAGNGAIGLQYMLTQSVSVAANNTLAASISGADVSNATNFIPITGGNPFANGDTVIYANAAGQSVIGGLAAGSYYVVEANSSGVKLSSTQFGDSVNITTTSGANSTLTSNTATLTVQFQDPYRLRVPYTSNTAQRYWEFFNVVNGAPGQSNYQLYNGNTAAQDELHVVVVDNGGLFSGTPGTVLEVYNGVSRASDAQNVDGSDNFYKSVINKSSAYVWVTNDRSTAISNTAQGLTSASSTKPANIPFSLGADGLSEANATLGVLGEAYDLFKNAEDIDISLVLQGKPVGGVSVVNGRTVQNFQLANYIIDNICTLRRDCIALISPDKSLVLNNVGNEAVDLVAWRGALHSTSYGVLDSGYKYQYDRYNDVYRWVPLNGDIGGLCVRTDNSNDAWWSPAGFNRGQIKNLVKLAYNPSKAQRDVLYPAGVNPVVTFPGQGTVLYGDKTLQAKPSAFDRINVRRLFIVLEKAISTAAKYSLFEFNDAFTRAQFRNLVTPYLRTVQGRRGITDFLIVCDDTNNTAQIIDTNQFVGDIYIKPARSINFIQLNFVAVPTGVQFSEVVGKF
jgi:hypothetical protein